VIIPELEVLLRQIELKYKKKFKSQKSGSSSSTKTGRGMDFKEVRLYSYGDDTRFIDWNVTSRMGEVYTKVFHEENDRIVNIFLDVSESMSFSGVNDRTKFFIGFQFMAFIGLLSILSGDKLNLILYSDTIEAAYRNLKTKNAMLKILKKVYSQELTHKKSNHLKPLEYLKNTMTRRSVSYIVSDFANIPTLQKFKPLRELHELYGIRIFDSIEAQNLDKILRYFFVKNIETNLGEHRYTSQFLESSTVVEKFFQANFLNLRTDSELGKTILGFLSK
jgi:uncharacterized protein (DUF58 family)